MARICLLLSLVCLLLSVGVAEALVNMSLTLDQVGTADEDDVTRLSNMLFARLGKKDSSVRWFTTTDGHIHYTVWVKNRKPHEALHAVIDVVAGFTAVRLQKAEVIELPGWWLYPPDDYITGGIDGRLLTMRDHWKTTRSLLPAPSVDTRQISSQDLSARFVPDDLLSPAQLLQLAQPEVDAVSDWPVQRRLCLGYEDTAWTTLLDLQYGLGRYFGQSTPALEEGEGVAFMVDVWTLEGRKLFEQNTLQGLDLSTLTLAYPTELGARMAVGDLVLVTDEHDGPVARFMDFVGYWGRGSPQFGTAERDAGGNLRINWAWPVPPRAYAVLPIDRPVTPLGILWAGKYWCPLRNEVDSVTASEGLASRLTLQQEHEILSLFATPSSTGTATSTDPEYNARLSVHDMAADLRDVCLLHRRDFGHWFIDLHFSPSTVPFEEVRKIAGAVIIPARGRFTVDWLTFFEGLDGNVHIVWADCCRLERHVSQDVDGEQ